ncbi:DUF4124 domain-containing protein [Tahibacter amnicola]|uniref:DUF4124 domain-containing protein n=1 Tax=Tahibacter amnicola TaxID=2976241 RepID=A0ABY6BEM4_9GAMM|nr:DUF4124 domain-containing protein [Tahibacter amnicola]UXI68250.1 DUF4124 domain-containing protein [Tahibacter amnicola]
MRLAVRISIVGLLVASLVGGLAYAQGGSSTRLRYKWRDEKGALHYADAITPEAARLGYEVVNGQGLVVKRVERAKTEEELAAAKVEAARVAAEKAAADEMAKNDAQMLAAYPTEEDLRKAMQAQIDLIDQNIQATEIGIASQEKSLAERLNHAAEQEREGKPVPQTVQNQISKLRKGLTDHKAFLEKRTADRAAMLKQMENELVHYRELKTRTKDH